MKIRQSVGSLVAIALFGAFMSVGASSVHGQAKKTGWWIRVNTTRMTASAISFQIGTSKEKSRTWRIWKSGQRVEFDVPTDFRRVAELYIRAMSNPHDAKAAFCVFYKDHGVEHFAFDGDEDHHMKQNHTDDACLP